MDLQRVDVDVGDMFKHISEGTEWLVTEVRDDNSYVLQSEAKTKDEHRYSARIVNSIQLSIAYNRL